MRTENAVTTLVQPSPQNTETDISALIQPPADLLVEVTNPATNEPDHAFPLQTSAWLTMQEWVTKALGFPLNDSDFQGLYGTFTDESSVETALSILGRIKTTAGKYGDPQNLISSLPDFQQAKTPPGSIYGHAVWLAAQTQLAAQQIESLLDEGLKDIGTETDPNQRLQDLTDLLTGQGGVNSYATSLRDLISHIDSTTGKDTGFVGAVSDFYDELNPELTGDDDSLLWYLGLSNNVYADAKNAVSADEQQIEQLTADIKKLNDEYVGFTAAASASPVLLMVPFYGILFAIADASVFGVLASKVKDELDAERGSLNSATEDEQKKSALVAQLGGFNKMAGDVETHGTDFLTAIGKMAGGWDQFSAQITTQLNALTPEDLENWDKFQTRLNIQTALDGWNRIEAKAEQFYQSGFVQFSVDAPNWLAAAGGEAR